MSTEKYNSISKTALFLIAEGNHELAFQLTQDALERLYINKEAGNFTNEQGSNELETELKKIYINSRTKLYSGKCSYIRIFLNTLIISAAISVAITMASFFIVNTSLEGETNNFLDGFKYEISHLRADAINKINITNASTKIKEKIPLIAARLKAEIERRSWGVDRYYFKNMILPKINKKYPLELKELPKAAAELRDEILNKIVDPLYFEHNALRGN